MPPNGGLFASLRGLIATAVGLLRTRFELLATELEEEKLRLLSIVMYGAVAFFMLYAGVLLLAVFLTVLFWDSHRLLVLGGLTAIFLVCGFGAMLLALRQVRAGSRLFSASLAEMTQDQRALQGKSEGKP
ncbi:MAG: phage holin family protein [Proteobacteria bacterium]|nr:phage holin family protein [Pseudomonadota bacterium]